MIGAQGLCVSVPYLHQQSKVTSFMSLSLSKKTQIETLSGLTVALATSIFDCKGLLHKAGNMLETDVDGDPHYRVVVDYKQHPLVENA